MNDKPVSDNSGSKPIGFVLRSISRTNIPVRFPWLNTKHHVVGAGNDRAVGNMRKYLGDAQVWKTRSGAESYVDTNPRSGISNMVVVPLYSDPRKTGTKAVGKIFEYRGHTIQPKLDFPKGGYLSNGRMVTSGFLVVKDHCNIMPGATWFHDALDAMEGIDVLLAVDGNADRFWEIMQPFEYTHLGQRVDMENGEVKKGRFRAVIKNHEVVELYSNCNPNVISAL